MIKYKKILTLAVVVVAFVGAGGTWFYLHATPSAALLPPSPSVSSTTTPPAPAPTVGVTTANPTVIAVNTPTVVTVTSVITDPTVIPTGVNLLRLNPNGSSTVIGLLRDDGTNGDAVAGDKIFTARITFNEQNAGQIKLQVSAAFRGVLKRVISDVLKIDVVVWPQVVIPSNGITFSYPTFGQPSYTEVQTAEDGSVAVDVIADPSGSMPLVQYIVGFSPNPTRIPLIQWFAQQVDHSGSILAGGGYQIMNLSNGVQVLLITGELPEAHLDCCGPISDLYAISPSGATIITVTTGQEHSFGVLGEQPSDVRLMYLTMLASMIVP